MIQKDSGLVSYEAWTVRLISSFVSSHPPLFFSSPLLVSLTCCAGIELLTIKLECVSSQMLGGPSQSILAHSFFSCHSRGRPFSSLKLFVPSVSLFPTSSLFAIYHSCIFLFIPLPFIYLSSLSLSPAV